MLEILKFILVLILIVYVALNILISIIANYYGKTERKATAILVYGCILQAVIDLAFVLFLLNL